MARIQSFRNVEIVAVSGTIYNTSSSFSGNDYSTVLAATDVQLYPNLAITVVNNSVNNLKSGSIEWSPNNTNWETDWDVSTLAGLTSSGITSLQIAGNSRRYLRIRAIPSGSGGALTGSLDVYVHANLG